MRVVAIDPNVSGGNTGGELGEEAQDTLTYTLTGLPTGATYDPATKLLSWTPTYAQAGTYQINFTATNNGDGTGVPSSAELVVTIQVRDTNGAPEIVAIDNQVVAVDGSIDIPIIATDPDAGLLTLSVEGLPGFATLIDNGDGTGLIRVTPLAGDRGNYALTVFATDDGNGIPATAISGSEAFILSVTALK